MQTSLKNETFRFIVQRGNIIQNALSRTLKPSFSPDKRIEVQQL